MDHPEIAHHFTPSIPKQLKEKAQLLHPVAPEALPPPDNPQTQAHILYEKLLDLAEIRIDIYHQSGKLFQAKSPSIEKELAPDIEKEMQRLLEGDDSHWKDKPPEAVAAAAKSHVIHTIMQNLRFPGIGSLGAQSGEKRVDMAKKGDFKALLAATHSKEGMIRKALLESKDRLKKTEGEITTLIEHPKVVEAFAKLRADRIRQLKDARKVRQGMEAIEELELQQERMARDAFIQGRQYTPSEQEILAENRQITHIIKEQVDTLEQDVEVFSLVRLSYLQELQKGFKIHRFAETPSRRSYIDTIRQMWAQGKKVLSTGPTGSGKTELFKYAAQSLFGERPEIVSGHELITNYEVYGKMGGGVKEGVSTIMFKAAAAVRALKRDVPLIIDEINVIPNKVLMRMKADWNARTGQTVTVQEDSEEELPVGKRFSWGATANVKSEKHPEREEIDTAIVRMFEPLIVDYFPPEELYDVMLASLMDVKGGVKLSPKDATETLRALTDATEWIQKAYQGEEIVIDDDPDPAKRKILTARGQGSLKKPATLRKAVLDPGKALDMLVGWEDAQFGRKTFREFLNEKIIAFVNNENFPEEDRYHLTEIFALQGFLRGVDVTRLRVGGLDQATLNAWNGYDGKRHVPKVQYTPAHIVARLDPYGVLDAPQAADVADLLGEEIGETEIVDEDTMPITTPAGKKKISSVGSVVAPAGLDTKGRELIDLVDVMYPLGDLPEDWQERFINYPDKLIEIAKQNPSTHRAVIERLSECLDNYSMTIGTFDMESFTIRLRQFVTLPNILKEVFPEVAKLLVKINKMNEWKDSTSSYADNTRTRINEISDILIGKQQRY